MDQVRQFVRREWSTKEVRDLNLKLVRNLGLFVGAVYLFRRYGSWMAI
ncbi:hypothetical protein CDCA_CDCA05G1551 [Cyanidium caldarium]|uniref:Uncharacterized protein n=1 Tax=Cyanidium caldarium TaxID=2771 RepID=A0AAV9ITY6_CYACA|nr:hypothetical protein CDCA_CDCA05G1551 [Cyanidium caldarium]